MEVTFGLARMFTVTSVLPFEPHVTIGVEPALSQP